MQSFSSSAPAPIDGTHVAPAPHVPAPAIVPLPGGPKPQRGKWGILFALVVIAAGAFAWYKYANPAPQAPAQVAVLRTVAISSGDLSAVVRIAGTVAAERYASIMAPRIQGNRQN